MTWNWKNWDGAAGRMKNYCQKSENFWKRTRLLSRWKDKTGREGVDLAFAIAEIGEEIGFTQALASKLCRALQTVDKLGVGGLCPAPFFSL